MKTETAAAVRLERVERYFVEGSRRHAVLAGLDLSVERGETVAIRGRSGSGKSTLLNLVAGIDVPDAGRVIVDGNDLAAFDERERTLFRRRQVGFVYQAFNLIPTLSVADNLRLVLELNAVPAGENRRRIADLLDAVGLADRADSYPDVLSGGEQQRVAIARALCHRPAVVLADEPTGNLDETSAAVVLDLLERLVRTAGGTMLIATHSSRVADTCDRILELREGRLERVPASSRA